MNLNRKIAELRSELESIEQAILCWNASQRGKVVDGEDHVNGELQ
jgi:hypothetical protein